MFLFVILTAQMMVVLDTTIVNVALPHIQQSLGFSSSTLSWVLNAYILAFGGLLLLGARAGDLFGRRRTFLVGIAVFTLSSLIGGLAPAGWMLLAARAVQGIGAALAAPSALSLLTTVFAEGQERVRAIGLYTTVSAAGGATGLVAGGLLTQLVSWRWVMFVNVPIGVTVWLLGRMVIVETERRRGRFDLAGALTCTLGVSAIVFGLVEAGAVGWTSPVTVSALAIGLVLLGLFVRQEQRVDEPIMPLRLLTHRTRSSANASRALLYAGFYGLFYFMAQFLQDVQGYSPLITGLAFLPMPISVFASSQLTSRVLLRRLSPENGHEPRDGGGHGRPAAGHAGGQRHRLPPDRRIAGPHRSRQWDRLRGPHLRLSGRGGPGWTPARPRGWSTSPSRSAPLSVWPYWSPSSMR